MINMLSSCISLRRLLRKASTCRDSLRLSGIERDMFSGVASYNPSSADFLHKWFIVVRTCMTSRADRTTCIQLGECLGARVSRCSVWQAFFASYRASSRSCQMLFVAPKEAYAADLCIDRLHAKASSGRGTSEICSPWRVDRRRLLKPLACISGAPPQVHCML